MPRGDQTGPAGMGPMTGRAAGYCAGYAAPGYVTPGPGRGVGPGFGRAWGRGRGWRHWYYATGLPGWARLGYAPAWGAPPAYAAPTPEQELGALKQQAEWLKGELDAVQKQITELEKE
jgi:hypothetical protein